MMRAQPQPFDEPKRSALAGSPFMRIDPLLLLATFGLIAFSLLTLGITTREDVDGSPHYFLIRQSVYALVGVIAMLVVWRTDYSRFRELRVGIYSALIVSILMVTVLGQTTRGSRRWIDFGFFQFQPSELGKVLLILALSAFVIDQARRISPGRRTARLLLIGLAPATLVVAQPDLGTGIVLGVITLAILFVAGVRWTHFAALGGLAAAATAIVLFVGPAAGFSVLEGYQQERLTAFVSPSEDPRDTSYQINQALIAIGSGQKTGRGEEATQTRLDFVPERHTDFIFAVIGERFGFIGAAFVLSLYALLVWRGLRILTLAKNFYGALIAGGITAMFMFQIFVNVGMSVGIMPITGIPLPLMSYGGSSVLVTFLAIGLLQSIYSQAQLTSKRREILF